MKRKEEKKVERRLDKIETESENPSVISDSLWPHGLYSLWNSPGQNAGVGSLSLLQGIFPTQVLNPGLPRCRQILYQLSHLGSPRILEWVAYPFFSRSSWPRNWTRVSNGNPLRYSYLENRMDGGAWWVTVHGVTKSRTRLSDFTSLHFTSLPALQIDSLPTKWELTYNIREPGHFLRHVELLYSMWTTARKVVFFFFFLKRFGFFNGKWNRLRK